MVSRYRDRLGGGQDPAEAMRLAVTRTGGIITSSGIILAGTFAVPIVLPMRRWSWQWASSLGVLCWCRV